MESNTNKKTLGIIIPYFKNSDEIEIAFKKLMKKVYNQLTDDMILFVCEDGQFSRWLGEYANYQIIIDGESKNKGVSHARNMGIDYLIDKVEYITNIDSDDDVADDYLTKLCEYCKDKTHDIVETYVQVIDQKVDEYIPDKMRNAVWAIAIKTSVIGDNRFNENLNVQEDVDFVYRVCDLTKYRKRLCPTYYYYNYGANPNSLVKRYNRGEISKERENNE